MERLRRPKRVVSNVHECDWFGGECLECDSHVTGSAWNNVPHSSHRLVRTFDRLRETFGIHKISS